MATLRVGEIRRRGDIVKLRHRRQCRATTVKEAAGTGTFRASPGNSREMPRRKVRARLATPPASPLTFSPGRGASRTRPISRAFSYEEQPPCGAQNGLSIRPIPRLLARFLRAMMQGPRCNVDRHRG